ncbi:N-methyl-L-tryptophan oxidase [Acidicapsa acidisoli]|uniref:N-methyl-L-tryptophan oxidase n=1 Tax=Acidicapsa acidisoli TaxID=1615681 RepID=UPI0021E0175E|nr:N-methyl-L-tryptophan oxidase [Acidicapsa acidisoli]
MSVQPHVIVLGLGAAGSSIAATLARRGLRVTGIEQFSPLHERGSSHGDTRIFRRVPHEGAVYVEMATASFHGWNAWNRLAGESLLVECGGIDAGPPESRLVKAAEELCERYGQPFELLDGGAFNRRHPHFRLPSDWRVVYQRLSGFVRPDATRSFLHKMARDAGARLMHGTAVLRIEYAANGVRIRTQDETLTCDFLVVAAGSWLPKLMPELHLELSTERRVLAWFQPRIAEEMTGSSFPIFCLDAGGGWYGMPTPDGRVKIGHDKHLRQRIDPNLEPILPDLTDAALLSGCVREYLAGFDEQPCEMKPCIYTLTEDHHFLIDRHPEHANVLVFSCCSGHGFKYAPVYGEIAANLIEEKPRMDLELFRLNRGHVPVTRFS